MKTSVLSHILAGTLFVGVAATVAPSIAHAAVMTCGVEDARGNTTIYVLSDWQGNSFQELSVVRNGATLIHEPDARPVWDGEFRDSTMYATYRPDKQYLLASGGATRSHHGMVWRDAVLMKNSRMIAKGECAMVNAAPENRGTTGNKRVKGF